MHDVSNAKGKYAEKKNIDEKKAKRRINRNMGRKERERINTAGYIGNKRAKIKSIPSIFCQFEQFWPSAFIELPQRRAMRMMNMLFEPVIFHILYFALNAIAMASH